MVYSSLLARKDLHVSSTSSPGAYRPSHRASSMKSVTVPSDQLEFSERHDDSTPPVGLDMAGHDTLLLGPKVVLLDTFIVDLLEVNTSAQTFQIKLILNMDWEDDGTIEPEVKAKRGLGRAQRTGNSSANNISNNHEADTYKTGKYVLKPEYNDCLSTTWNPEVVLVNAISDASPVEAGSKFHSIQMFGGRPIISRSVLYQPECRCEFTFSNFPFDETDLVIKFSSNKWNSDQVVFKWSERLQNKTDTEKRLSMLDKTQSFLVRKTKSFLRKTVDKNAINCLSEFQITDVHVYTTEKDVNSMQRYDNSEGAFSQANLIIHVRRDPYSYLLRVASVAELLMFLEFMSFLTDNRDLGARFSVSGTIFLAMVSLYGPMAEALPKVSVVTRVDKWCVCCNS
ncbi:hypothetical protein ACHAXS_010908 [Conticribra weissflogii]